MYNRLLFLPAVALLTACTGSQIALPSSTIASTQQYELVGLGGWYKGNVRLGLSQLRFHRTSAQERKGPMVFNYGGSSFAGSGPELGGSAAGRCSFGELEADLGLIAVPTERLTYHCRFERDGRSLDGGMFLAETPYGAGSLAGRTRSGEVKLGDVRLDIRPIHHSREGGRPAGSPLGYSFHHEGRQIGAVDINGKKRVYLPTQSGAERDAVLFASLALSLFWDPGA